ncbi:hypothetical protein LSTR_LSTR008802 [Laodelphax striatellus]|uniref:BTB domain-containing protein n=1 Tax=Laodelphax striatellus TaxID=195883 RepID=A0A482X3X3_LAOST|nr:hypothetical protein LSTR_LSTR008802 [Laodelphax striatellus]
MESKRPASAESGEASDEKRRKCEEEDEQKTESKISLSSGSRDEQNIQASTSTAEVIIIEDKKEQDVKQKDKSDGSGDGNSDSQVAGETVLVVNGNESERWQISCRTIKDRMSKLYKSSYLTDCVFIVGDTNIKEYKLHSLILSMASPVFEDLLSDDTNKEIKISDVESDVFDQILEYIYLDLLHLESVEKAQSLYRAAQKFKLTLIIERAVQLMMSNMSIDNIWPTMESARVTCDNILRGECLKYFKKHVKEMLKHPKFLTVDRSLVEDLVSEEILEGVLESELVTGVTNWAKAQCEINNIPNTLESKREVLGSKIVSKLRFLTLPQLSFVKEVAFTSTKPEDAILTREESYAILLNLIVPGIEPLPEIVCKESRVRIAGKLRVSRKVLPGGTFPPPFSMPFPAAQFDKMVVMSSPSPLSAFGAKNFCCEIVVSYPIKLLGIQVPTFFLPQNMSEYEENYIVTVQSSNSTRNLFHTTWKGKVKYNSQVDIMFKDSVQFDRNIKYSIYIYTSNMYYVSRRLSHHENRPPVQFTFKDTVSYFGAPSNAKLITDLSFLTELIYNL